MQTFNKEGRGLVRSLTLLLTTLIAIQLPAPGQADSSANVVVLGDSQISFGAGEVYLDFFKNIKSHCKTPSISPAAIERLGARKTVAIGVRSTSLETWTARGGKAKNPICEVDKQYGVNAGVYGLNGNRDRKFVQIGRDRGVKFCHKNQ